MPFGVLKYNFLVIVVCNQALEGSRNKSDFKLAMSVMLITVSGDDNTLQYSK
jgi:hypothetical protein